MKEIKPTNETGNNPETEHYGMTINPAFVAVTRKGDCLVLKMG